MSDRDDEKEQTFRYRAWVRHEIAHGKYDAVSLDEGVGDERGPFLRSPLRRLYIDWSRWKGLGDHEEDEMAWEEMGQKVSQRYCYDWDDVRGPEDTA